MATAAASATPSAADATTLCQVGGASRSSSSTMPSSTPTSGFATEPVATAGASRAVCSAIC